MTDPEITAALEELIATTPPPVTVWGGRHTEPTFVALAGHIDWSDTETEAREWLAEEQERGFLAELVRVTGRLHVEG